MAGLEAANGQTARKGLAVVIAIALCLLSTAVLFSMQPWQPTVKMAPVAPKGALQDYSWPELCAIANEISACPDERQAYAVGARYGLCDAQGALCEDSVAVKLADGTELAVLLAGIWHDERSDGTKAGLTFVFAAYPAEHAMNHEFESAEGLDADSVGGWSASDMRAWLNGDFWMSFPQDVRSGVCSVEKRTVSMLGSRAESAEPGHLAGTGDDWASTTSDKLWLLSAAEVCGNVPVNEDADIDESIAQLYACEGKQYRLFADAGARPFEPNASLVRKPAGASGAAGTWWLRSKTLEFGEGFWFVGADGTPANGSVEEAAGSVADGSTGLFAYWGPDHARGVIAGFCL